MSDKQRQSDQELLKALLGPDGPELTCEECFAKLDRTSSSS